MITSCAKTRAVERALDMYDEMTTERGLVPSLEIYNALLLALSTSLGFRGEIPGSAPGCSWRVSAPTRGLWTLCSTRPRMWDLLEARAVWNESVRLHQADSFLFGYLIRAYSNAMEDWMLEVQKR
ncbi:hypothetical protein M427DRAFT_355470 [Gonapodya prolifera JEL478]|uniref:Pentacotripeptide-repeat region of PRORP domain-containing protein n=1 Tax=Gonapodya prolifera (strain JEL478) TaxID=1344416 RepID=A0A139ABH8_GONPJ|nr:hypothetical protein M427DRAFT_355470 [Gonapodya prolifera JEL478]|eukprot:KXS14182.1 hypothetical protein M427DRAFT_355470 [Gonapodya prolifera JEL478]